MPAIDASSYDLFDLNHYDEESLSLYEASERAAQMRRDGPARIHRVVQADVSGERFHVESIYPLELYVELAGKLNARWAKILSRRASGRLSNG